MIFSHASEVVDLFKVGEKKKKKPNQSLKNKYFGMYNAAFVMYFKELDGWRIIMQFELSLRKAVLRSAIEPPSP